MQVGRQIDRHTVTDERKIGSSTFRQTCMETDILATSNRQTDYHLDERNSKISFLFRNVFRHLRNAPLAITCSIPVYPKQESLGWKQWRGKHFAVHVTRYAKSAREKASTAMSAYTSRRTANASLTAPSVHTSEKAGSAGPAALSVVPNGDALAHTPPTA